MAIRTLSACLALALSLCGVGCSDDSEEPAPARAATTAPATATEADASAATSDVLVRVGKTEITRARYDAVNIRLERNYGADRGYPGRRYFVPPHYRLCVKDRRLRRSVAPDTPPEAVRQECREIFWGGRRQLLGNLIEAEWLAQEAAKQHVKVPPGFIDRLSTLPTTLSQRALEAADGKVSDQAIRAYYDKYSGLYQQPEQRRFREIVSATKAKARRAKAALRAGEDWTAVARRYGKPGLGATEPVSLSRVGLEAALGDAIFEARPGELLGPLAVTSGFSVVKLERVLPPRQLSLAEVRDSIEVVLSDYERQRAGSDYWRNLRTDARRETICLTELKVPLCANAPEEGFDAYGGFDEPVLEAPSPPA